MYTIELDISHEATKAEVAEFAMTHNCAALLIEEFGPAGENPLYQFFSNSYDSLLELATEILQDSSHAKELIEVA